VTLRPPLARRDVVLIQFPFTDLSTQKLRPALLVGRPTGNDLVVAFISTRTKRDDPRAECLLESNDPEFRATGLRWTSTIRLNRVATLHRRLVRRRLGRIGTRTEHSVARALRYVFEI
jgi:mRNA-degrading endonuclease toxin of MazEF toxin-antitoxin module